MTRRRHSLTEDTPRSSTPGRGDRTFISKFPAWCASCQKSIEAGETVRGHKEGDRWVIKHLTHRSPTSLVAAQHLRQWQAQVAVATKATVAADRMMDTPRGSRDTRGVRKTFSDQARRDWEAVRRGHEQYEAEHPGGTGRIAAG